MFESPTFPPFLLIISVILVVYVVAMFKISKDPVKQSKKIVYVTKNAEGEWIKVNPEFFKEKQLQHHEESTKKKIVVKKQDPKQEKSNEESNGKQKKAKKVKIKKKEDSKQEKTKFEKETGISKQELAELYKVSRK